MPEAAFVADVLPTLPAVSVPRGKLLFRGYDGTWGYDEPNPGFGDARFSPFDAADGHRVPTMYLAERVTGALLETVFHDAHHGTSRLVYEKDLRENLLAHVALPGPLRLADLRDPVLSSAGVDREQMVAGPSEHYPCTRRLARAVYDADVDGAPVQGVLWHSRQAELSGASPEVVLVVFADRYPAARGDWVRVGPGSQNLFEGPGRLLVDEVAVNIGATVVTA